MFGDRVGIGGRRRKYPHDRRRSKQRGESDHNRSAHNKLKAKLQDPFQAQGIPAAVIETDDRRYAHREPHVQSIKKKLPVQYDGNGRNAVLAQQAQHDNIKQVSDDRIGNIRYHLGKTVEAALRQISQAKPGAYNIERTAYKKEIKDSDNGGNKLPDSRGQRRSGDTEPQRAHKKIIENHVAKTAGDGQGKTQPGISCCDKKRLEEKLKDAGGGKIQGNLQIRHAVCHQKVGGAEKADQRAQKDRADSQQKKADHGGGEQQHGEKFSGFPVFPFAHFFCAQSAAAGSDHNAAGNRQGDERIYDVQSGQRVSPQEPRYENAVHDGIERHKNHHNDSRERKAQKREKTKIFCNRIRHRKTSFLISIAFAALQWI